MKRHPHIFLYVLILILSACHIQSQTDPMQKEQSMIEDKKDKTTQKAEEESLRNQAVYEKWNIRAQTDYNHNGTDDFSDLVIGARRDAQRHPHYNGAYVSENNGYPDPDIGVCTDVVWRAFQQAGYSIRSMLNADIKNHPTRYPMVTHPDPKIDFRRVKTLRPFFEAYAQKCEIEKKNPKEWQPGDIVIFLPNDYHIGVLSDKRNKEGFPLVFHNQGQNIREEDFLPSISVSGHYRFVAEKIPKGVLKPWEKGEAGPQNEKN